MRKRTVSVIVLLIIAVLLGGCGNKKPEETNNNNDLNNQKEVEKKANTNPGIINDQIIDGITIEQTSLTFEEGTSTLIANVKNNSNNDIVVNGVKAKFKDEDGNVIIMLDGYIGSNIGPGEGKLLTIHVSQDLTNATSVEYELNK